ncbi:hypothetical protein [Halorubrum ezzemoulense]|uniref:hypothetical protein n=1 Tax=Halorubrum ezzemoulense TaxID=337243 RepID=UPI0023312D06|nr:hypothetical protein [Halorubrum ezzemoulense]MDB9252879.1 hypothetical protein [Halorubrum ezzemoulense]MDB9256737.1 hypothetical protein [Halorubrum ezzemoulense]MDB9277045.1 hypothetical protein [Halorubrum ezzemoulense]
MTTGSHNSDPETDDGILSKLAEASIVTDDGGGALTLTDEFRTVWRRRMEHLRERDPIELLALLLDADPETLTLSNEGSVTVTRSDQTVGEWPSEAALIADVAAFVALSEQLPGWEELDGTTRDELIARLRVFLESCPQCGGDLEDEGSEVLADEVAVPELSCVECGAALL